MTKQECENQMLSKLKEIWDIYKEYNPQGGHLSLTCIQDTGETPWFDIFDSVIPPVQKIDVSVGGEKVEQ